MNDYIRQLEKQNEELRQMLARSQRFNEYYYNNRSIHFRCGITFVHNRNTTDPEFYTSNEYTHRVNRIHEHGDLGHWVDSCCTIDEDVGLVKMGMHVGMYRNGRCIWDVFFRIMPSNKWIIDAIQFGDYDVVSGKNVNCKEFEWDEVMTALSDRSQRYKQSFSI